MFDPEILTNTFWGMVPKPLEDTDSEPKQPESVFEEMGFTAEDAAALMAQEPELWDDEEALLIEQGLVGLADETALAELFESYMRGRDPKPAPAKTVTPLLELEPIGAPEPSSPVIREPEVQVLEPTGKTGVSIDDDWWKDKFK